MRTVGITKVNGSTVVKVYIDGVVSEQTVITSPLLFIVDIGWNKLRFPSHAYLDSANISHETIDDATKTLLGIPTTKETMFTALIDKGMFSDLEAWLVLINQQIVALKARSANFVNEEYTKSILTDLHNYGLSDSAVVVTTPTAYSTGILHSVKPVEVLGAELVTNGGFDDATGWTLTGGSTIANGVGRIFSSDGAFADVGQIEILTIGKKYKATYTVVSSVSGSLQNAFNSTDIPSTVGTHTIEFITTNLDFKIKRKSGVTDISIDNVSVKEVINADFDFTRASSGTRINEQGLVELMGANIPRFTWEGGKPSLLLEPQSTNLLPYSEDFSFWTKTGNAVATDNGSYYTITGLNGAGNNDLNYNPIVNSANLTVTFQARLRGVGTLRLGLSNNVNQGFSKIITLTSDWKNHEITETFNATTGEAIPFIDDSGGTATQYDIEFAQLEALPYATSYIPTAGTTVTRSADVCNNADVSSVVNSVEGTMYVEMAALANTTNVRRLSISDGTANNSVSLSYTATTNQLQGIITVGGVVQATLSHTLPNALNFNSVALKWKANDFGLKVGGVEVATDVLGSSFGVGILTKESFTDGGGTLPVYGKIRQSVIFNSASAYDQL